MGKLKHYRNVGNVGNCATIRNEKFLYSFAMQRSRTHARKERGKQRATHGKFSKSDIFPTFRA